MQNISKIPMNKQITSKYTGNPSENWASFVYRHIIKEHIQMAIVLLICLLCMLSHVLLFVTPCTIACQVPQSMGFSRQEYWSGLPLPPPGDLPDPGVEPVSPALQAYSFLLSHLGQWPKILLNIRKDSEHILQKDLSPLLRVRETSRDINVS